MFKRLPLLVPFFGFICGILAAGFYPFSTQIIWLLFSGISAISLVILFFNSSRHWSIYLFQFTLIGLILTALQNEKLQANHYTNTASPNGYFKATLDEQPRPTKRAIRLTLTLDETLTTAKQMTGSVFLYVPKSEEFLNLKTGDEVLFKTRFNTIEPPKNPHEFDYKNYMNLHQIYWQGYTTDVKPLTTINSGFHSKVDQLRQTLLAVIESLVLTTEEKAVSSALLLGYRYNLSNETEQAFAGAGAMHVLAVSGLHVGILYMITAFLLKFDRRKRHRNHWTKVALILLIIWSYAVLTGLSPSVNRAALMFTFISLGALLKRQPSTYQAILSSAFVLLVYNPNNLFEVGFQLSYAAVIGILYIQPKLYYPWQPKSVLLDKIWAITAVSIAAQLATFPLGLYYFHQFPLLFLVSNLIVIPAAYLLMCYGLVMLMISLIVPLPGFLILPFQGVLWLMIKAVHLVESIPYAVMDEISISRFELILFVIVTFAAISALFEKRKRSLLLAAICTLLLTTSFAWHWINTNQTNTIMFYSVNRQTAFSVQQAKQGYLFADAALLSNDSKMLFHINHHLWASGAQYEQVSTSAFRNSTSLNMSNGCLEVFSQRIVLLNHPVDTAKFQLNPQYIYVAGPVHPPAHVPENAQIILQNGLNPLIQKEWMQLESSHNLASGYVQFVLEEASIAD